MSNYSRGRTRKFLYQLLYASTFSKVDLVEFKESFFSWVFDATLDEDYLNTMYEIILNNEVFLLSVIAKYAPKFRLEDMELSYVLPLLIWIWEILYFPEEIPLKVSINEAVEISKVYGDDSSRKMVNWVLFSISKDYESLLEEPNNIINPDIKTIFKK